MLGDRLQNSCREETCLISLIYLNGVDRTHIKWAFLKPVVHVIPLSNYVPLQNDDIELIIGLYSFFYLFYEAQFDPIGTCMLFIINTIA